MDRLPQFSRKRRLFADGVRCWVRHVCRYALYLEQLHRRHKENRSGKLADYIPELTRIDPDLFGIAFATMDGYIYEAGDTAACSPSSRSRKAIIYGLALEDHGREEVLRQIGVEPSGEAFNSIAFDEKNNRPFNPMVNAGRDRLDGADQGRRHGRALGRASSISSSALSGAIWRWTMRSIAPRARPAIATAPSPSSNSIPA